VGVRPDPTGDLSRAGIGILSFFWAKAELHDNEVVGARKAAAAFASGAVSRGR
jgi:hypothetical protein